MTTGPDLDDLRTVLRTHGTALPDNVDREHQVHDRIAARRRRRVAAGTAGTVVLAAAATVLALTWLPNGADTGAPKPAPVVNQTQGDVLPQYLRGGRLIASKEAVDARGITLTFTPTSLNFGFALSCKNADLAKLQHTPPRDFTYSTVNGHGSLGVGCGTEFTLNGDASFGRGELNAHVLYGVNVGEPVTVQWHFGDGGDHPGTAWRIGVYQAVPIADYPFPSAPAELAPLSAETVKYSGGYGKPVVFPPARPEKVAIDCCSMGYHYEHGLTVNLESVAPGHIVMYVNDKPVWRNWFWDYTNQNSSASFSLEQLRLNPGELATIRFTTTGPPRAATYAAFDTDGHTGR
jgi:hypothetical protein